MKLMNALNLVRAYEVFWYEQNSLRHPNSSATLAIGDMSVY